MIFGSESFTHEQWCQQGHSSASTIATVKAALAAVPDIDSSAMTIHMIGPELVLEGYITNVDHRDKAVAVAAMFVGIDNVHDRMLKRFPNR